MRFDLGISCHRKHPTRELVGHLRLITYRAEAKEAARYEDCGRIIRLKSFFGTTLFMRASHGDRRRQYATSHMGDESIRLAAWSGLYSENER